MVTTRKTSDSKVIAMDESTGGAAAPPRTLLEEVNSQLMCVLCRGYYIDATTIVECLHSFCRSCIVKHLQVKSYCPICEMMINSAKPNIKADKALQDIVYKLVPGLFQREMQRRQAFYASRPGPAASATPEQRGEDTERIIFSPEDVISFSLEYMDISDHESGSSRSSESGNESTSNEAGAPTRRYLQCPAVVNISHLKKFLSMKYDIDASNFFVDILYKRVPLPDYYTLMDIAYIYNWKRNEPMRFFYQISDFSAIRDRFGFFGLKRPGLAPASPAPSQLTEAGSDASSGTFSPTPDEKAQADFASKSDSDFKMESKASTPRHRSVDLESSHSSSVDVQKSEFLNSFELTAKCGVGSGKCSNSPSKQTSPPVEVKRESVEKSLQASPKKLPTDKPSGPVKMDLDKSPAKRKSITSSDQLSDGKKIKLSPEKKMTESAVSKSSVPSECSLKQPAAASTPVPKANLPQSQATATKVVHSASSAKINTSPLPPPSVVKSASKPETKLTKSILKPPTATSGLESLNSFNKSLPAASKSAPVKRKLSSESSQPPHSSLTQKPLSGSKIEASSSDLAHNSKNVEAQLQPPTNSLKVSSESYILPAKINPPSKVNIPPSKVNAPPPKMNIPPRLPIKSDNTLLKPPDVKKDSPKKLNFSGPNKAVKMPNSKAPKGDPLKSLFHSCNLNIPSSLSITLTDQKNQKSNDAPKEIKDSSQGKSTPPSSSQMPPTFPAQKPTNPEVHNYIEILKLPDAEAPNKGTDEKNGKTASNSTKTGDGTGTGGKGPVPNLKPISDTKSSKTLPITKPQTFQQTFLQSLQQQSDKPKYIKTRLEYPKSNQIGTFTPPDGVAMSTETPVPANTPPTPSAPKLASLPTASVPPPNTTSSAPVLASTPSATVSNPPKYKPVPMAQPIRKPNPPALPKVVKSDSALDLSTPHTVQSQLGPQQTKALETMQSINNLAMRNSQRMTSPSQVFSQDSFKMNSISSPIRIPIPPPHSKHLKTSTAAQISGTNSPKHFPEYFHSSKSTSRSSNNGSPIHTAKSSSSQQTPSTYSSSSQRSQTRSPSSSPKLVIACPSPKSQSPEESTKQLMSPRNTDASSQSNLISSSQITSSNHTSNESAPKELPKATKPPKASNAGRASGSSGHSSHSKAGPSGSSPNLSQCQIQLQQQAYLRQQLELQTQLGLLPPGAAMQWYNNPVARAHFENIMKTMNHNNLKSFSNINNVKDNK